MLGCFEWWRSIPTSPPLEALLLPFCLPVALSIDKAIFVAWQNHGCPSSTLLMPFLCFIQRDDDLHINYFLPFPLPPPWHCQFSHLPLALCFFLFAFFWPCLAACSLFCICWKLVYFLPSLAFSSSVQSAPFLASIFAASSWPFHKARHIGPFFSLLSVLFLFLLLTLCKHSPSSLQKYLLPVNNWIIPLPYCASILLLPPKYLHPVNNWIIPLPHCASILIREMKGRNKN